MENRDELICKLAVSMTPGMTAVIAHAIEDSGVGVEDFVKMDTNRLSTKLGLPKLHHFEYSVREKALERARNEIKFIEQHSIRPLYLTDDDYPWLLREMPDAPVMLYVLGDANLSPEHIMSIVGTRKPTAYGSNIVHKVVEDMAVYFPDITIVSGLAYGIDTMAHVAAMDFKLPTIAVVAHGLHMIYPAANRPLAREIIKKGGAIISEYPSGVTPFRRNFLERNRIVAGISELTLVAESPIKGGAMSTANIANTYSREVMAAPGRVGDVVSEGCNHLIRKNKAHLYSAPADIIELMGWAPMGIKVTAQQRNLFPELTGDAALVCDSLRYSAEAMSIDQLHQKTHISVPTLMSLLNDLEFDGIITRRPGARYSII